MFRNKHWCLWDFERAHNLNRHHNFWSAQIPTKYATKKQAVTYTTCKYMIIACDKDIYIIRLGEPNPVPMDTEVFANGNQTLSQWKPNPSSMYMCMKFD